MRKITGVGGLSVGSPRATFACALSLSVVIASGCSDYGPTAMKSVRPQATVVLVNDLSGAGTWNWKVVHTNGLPYWYFYATYGDGTSDIFDATQGTGSLRQLPPEGTVILGAYGCLLPRTSPNPACSVAAEDSRSGPIHDQVIGWDPPNPYYLGPGDDFIVEFGLPPASAPGLHVSCQAVPGGAGVVERGGALTCTVAEPSFGGFQWSFAPTISTVPTVSRPETPEKEWAGTVVASGTVTVTGWSSAAAVGVLPRESATAAVSVSPRAWARSPIAFPSGPSTGGQGPLSLMPTFDQSDKSWNIAFGLFVFVPPRLIATDSVVFGPNSGYSYVLSNFVIPQPIVYINAALNGNSAFAALQTGRFNGNTIDPATRLPYCRASALALLAVEVKRHEGLTSASNSHYGVWTAGMQAATLSSDVEQLVFPTQRQADSAAFALFDTWKTSTEGKQGAFDSVEYPMISKWSGNCQLRYQP